MFHNSGTRRGRPRSAYGLLTGCFRRSNWHETCDYVCGDRPQDKLHSCVGETEVGADGLQPGVELISETYIEEVPIELTVLFVLAYGGLDHVSALGLTFNLFVDTVFQPELEYRVRLKHVVAAVALVVMDALDLARRAEELRPFGSSS